MSVFVKIFLAAILTIPLLGFAAPSPKNFTYKESNSKSMTSFDSSLDKSMESFGYRTMKMEGSTQSGFALQWVNRIYLQQGENVRGRVFIKSGLTVDKEMQLGKIYTLDSTTFVTAFPSSSQGQYLVFFANIRQSLVEDISRSLGKTLGFNHARFHFLNTLLVPEAQAEGKNYYCAGETPTNAVFSTAISIMKNGGACVHDIGVGVWQSTGGFLRSVVHAAGSLGETWQKIKTEAEAFGDFFANFQESLAEFKDQIASLPWEIQAKILCELAGNIGAGIMISALTAGAGSASFAKGLADAVSKVSLMRQLAGAKSLASVAEKLGVRAERMRVAEIIAIKPVATKGEVVVAIKTLGIAACNDIATLRGTRAGYGEDLPMKENGSSLVPTAK
jgi:hypothetical protein